MFPIPSGDIDLTWFVFDLVERTVEIHVLLEGKEMFRLLPPVG